MLILFMCIHLRACPLIPKNDVPVLLDLHGLFELTPVAMGFSLRDKLVVELLKIIEKVILMNLDSYGDQIHIIAQSPYIKEYIIKRFGIPEHKVFVIPDGIDLSLVPIFDETRRLKIREKLNLIDKYVIAYAGTPSYFHGFLDLLYAFRYVHQVYDKSHLLLMVPNKNIVISQLRRYNIDLSYVTVLENVRKPWYYEILYASDVLVLPHRGNTQFDFIYSNKLLDYIVTGRFIVGYDLMPVRDMLARYPLKILAKPNNPKALAEAILEGRAFRDSHVDGRQYIRDYEWSILAKEVVNVYDYLLKI
ncbi:glycosyltransferase [Vulcanisaeta distributa]|uniref:glycosyltransferase n=1 Tax=Vulcanisaeta distributa TaxID=164451 RepID=UPI0006CFE2E6|nr:glycosyltransferase [Vulcanisaeta distributa]